MSQDVSNPQSVLAPLELPADPPPSESYESQSFPDSFPDSNAFSVETYADNLMDEIFQEVHHILERGGKLPTETLSIEPEETYVELEPLSLSSMSLPPVLLPRQPLVSEPFEDDEDDLDDLELVIRPPEEPQRKLGQSMDSLLLTVACFSLVATLGLWAVLQSRWRQAPELVLTSRGEVVQADADADFLGYMQQSLEQIDRRAESSQVARAPGADSDESSLPRVSVAGTPQQAAAPNVIERVYIPIYQPPQPLYSIPNVLPNAQAPNAQAPDVQLPAPTVPSAPLAAAPLPAPVPVAPDTMTSPANIAPANTHVLVGILELGDRSAALFEVNGTPQRIYLGENIGGSGWTLVSVQNQEAIMRRNGEVRSIYIGQQF